MKLIYFAWVRERIGKAEEDVDLPADVLRNQINPAYQHLFELLSGSATDKTHPPAELSALKQSRLLVHDGRGHHRFDIAETVLYAPRGGIRELQGIDDELWTFVLEGRPAASAPLQRLFGARNLEEVLDWNPQPDESPFDEVGLDRFRIGSGWLELPVAGVFEVNDEGLITLWRDYFDMGAYQRQMAELTAS